jgi:hypothetical protein
MCGGIQRRCGHLLIHAGAIVLLAGASSPRAAEPAAPGLPAKEQAEPPETMFGDITPPALPGEDVTPEVSEETLPISTADAHVPPYRRHRLHGAPRSGR